MPLYHIFCQSKTLGAYMHTIQEKCPESALNTLPDNEKKFAKYLIDEKGSKTPIKQGKLKCG